MNKLDEILYINSLLDIYGECLSPQQKEILKLYFCFNLSISEIANDKQISRSAVNDALKKGEIALKNLEDKLHCYKKDQQLKTLINKIKENKQYQELLNYIPEED